MSRISKSDIKEDEWLFVMAGADVLVCRGRIKCRKEIDDYYINEINTIEYYNEDQEFVGEVSLSVICQYLEIPSVFI
jgi:ribosomal 30S subunit maturation factor RimM